MSTERSQTAEGSVVRAFAALSDAEIVEMIRRNGGLDTVDVANRFGLSVEDARKRLRSIEATGAISSERSSFSLLGRGGCGVNVLKWEAVTNG